MSDKGRILAVDDTLASLKLLTELLTAEGYAVRSAPSGEMALQSALKSPPDLIVLDVRMPGMNGFEVCRQLKAEPRTAAVPVIFLSGLAEVEDKVEAFRLGAVDFMTKPFQREELLIRVQTHLESARLHNQLEVLVSERTEELKRSLEFVAEMLRTMQEGVVTVDAAGKITFANETAQEILGIDKDVEGTYFQSSDWRQVDERGEAFPPEKLPLAIALGEKKRVQNIEHGIVSSSGDTKWLSVNASPLWDKERNVVGGIASFRDFTAKKADEAKIEKLAFYDSLTGLANRSLFFDRLQRALVSSQRSEKYGALLYIDLDDFKTLNDSLGHDVGDALLMKVAKSLLECVRVNDTVARLGGDEFVIMLEDLSSHMSEAADQAKNVAKKVLDKLNRSFAIGVYECRTTPSIGVTLFSQLSAEEHLKQADIAMYQAKKAGRNTLRFFDPEMQEKVNSRARLEAELRNAIVNKEFLLFYQVQVDAASRAVGAEALLRWNHPVRGYVSPAEFIPLAEETGLIIPIGEQVLDMACAQIKLWQEQMPSQRFPLSVNVSVKQFQQADFVEQVRKMLERHRIDPALLKLEPTESILLEHMDEALQTMRLLKEIGVHFALDDFGTGYSSLQYLKQLPLDQLKIDQSFVRDLVIDKNDQAIVFTVIVMAQELGLDVIAEGVESEEQRAVLLQHGCRHFQGYLFGRPMPLKDFDAALHATDF